MRGLAVALAGAVALPAHPQKHWTPHGVLEFRDGTVYLQDRLLAERSNPKGKRAYIGDNETFFIGKRRPNFFLAAYSIWDGRENLDNYFVIDLAGPQPLISNEVSISSDYKWDDNNYVIAKGDKVYFGFYEPQRIQFVYEAGRITPNPGKWMGPRKVIENFPMKSSDPCFNVSGVEECREEIERARQRKLAGKDKDKDKDKDKGKDKDKTK